MNARRTTLSRLVLATALITACAGCGVPQDREPRAIPADRVPFGLLDVETPLSTPSSEQGLEEVLVYLVSGERLAGVPRRVPGPVTEVTAVRTLLAGPTSEEAKRGIRSALDTTVPLSPTGRSGGVVSLELGETFSTIGTTDEILAVAQIVYTMTGLPGVEAVRFMVSGRPIEVPTGDGTLRSVPLRRADFDAVSPS